MLASLLLSSALFLTFTLADVMDIKANLPQCSLDCIAAGAQEHGCDVADIPCMCSKIQDMIKTVSPCLVKAGCELVEITDTAKIVNELCAAVTGSNATNTDTTNTNTDAGNTVPTLTETAVATNTPGAANNLRSAGWTVGMVAVVAGALL